ncbi:hypothetical protein A946_09810 [Methylacidiphilum kamchatkense Kam1]|uniref:Uncharacterized protein n=1 Tax=Methylacidiphilum kamchatkense Kam1 TaxID=1202785 RepID=A0A0C1RIQ9_9BACT|nr:hypothetical protein [Methylacidiphilum kamchatkense]KIE57942.1 hypothetical protein A946_09810 [Methylacidiphilum kamchatkense Kam1]QDQ42370.1 hypothetical protein kam1_1142 [Methylacidiphilum kamchatkense Kam1]
MPMALNFPFRKPSSNDPIETKEKQPIPHSPSSVPHSSTPFPIKSPHTPHSESVGTSSFIHFHVPFIPKSSLHSPLPFPPGYFFSQQMAQPPSPFQGVSSEPSELNKNPELGKPSFKVGNFPLNPLSQQPFQKPNAPFSFLKPEEKEKKKEEPFSFSFKQDSNVGSPPSLKSRHLSPIETSQPGKREFSTTQENPSSFASFPTESIKTHEMQSAGNGETHLRKDKKQEQQTSLKKPEEERRKESRKEEKEKKSANIGMPNRIVLGLSALVSLLTATYFVLAYYDIF